METLPEEVLAEVMAMVVPDSADIKQVCDLLAMRLVCRRWSEVMLSPVLWSRRRIRMPERFSVYGREHRKCLALLRLAPALRSLELNISDTTVGRLVSKALSDGECRIKSLKIVFGRFNISLSKLFNKVLTMRQDTIEELYLDVHIVNSSVDSLVVAPLLSAVEDLKRLKRLTLGTLVKVKGCNCGFHTPSITYKFEGLGALEHVTFLPRLSRDLVISVLNCSKGNLLTAKWQRGNYSHGLGYCPVPQKLYRCEQLQELTLKYEDIDLIDVHRLSRLQKITFQDIFTSVLDVGRTLDIRRSASTLPELKTVELFTEYKPNSHDLKQLEQLLALHPDLNITVSQKSTKL